MSLRYKNYIFDFGKVIVEFEPEIMMAPYITDKADRELAGDVIFDRLYWDRLDGGIITDSEVVAAIRERLPERLGDAGVEVYQNWYRHLPFIEGVRELIKNGQVATTYVDMNGNPTYDKDFNPNGSVCAIEGITSKDGRILGKMGHSERIGKSLYKNIYGDFDMKIFKSGVEYYE